MKIYLVGGAVRDQLLGRPIKERDWVVVGASPEELLALGYQPVGKDFPVFLHPETHEEYALARTERKTKKGYHGFEFHAAPDVSLEDDLLRRDLTINAMAQDEDGSIIDPYGGQEDLNKKLLRHVSPAFKEDPVRILRIARFAAKLNDFRVHPDTNKFMQEMVRNGEVDALVAERVWQELQRALDETEPKRFFEVLNDCDALETLFPEIDLNGPAIESFIRACESDTTGPIRLATLLHTTTFEQAKAFISRYRLPREYSELILLLIEWLPVYINCHTTEPSELLHLLRRVDALRRPERFQLFLQACDACAPDQHACAELLEQAVHAIANVDITPLQENNLQGKDFADALKKLHIEAIKKIINPNN